MKFASRVQIGRHYPVDSPVHSLDAAAKIACSILLIAAVFLADSPYLVLGLVVFTFFLIYLSGLPSLQVLRGLRAVVVILAITSLTQLLFASGKVLVSIGPVDITNAGIENGIVFSLRIVVLTLLVSLLTMTTAPTDLVRGFERLFGPLARLRVPVHRLAMVLMLAFRFLPVLLTRADDVVTAQVSRGADFESRNLFRRVGALFPLLLPLFTACFRDAEELSLAMACRGWRGDASHVPYREARLRAGDLAALLVSLGALALALFL